MARFHADQVDNFGGQGGGGFFTLKNDGDVAKVRFCYNSIDDVEGLSVHRVKVGKRDDGKDIFRYVNCLRDYNQPLDDCPFCRESIPVQAKLFIPLYDVKNNTIKTWERGKNFFSKITSLVSRYPDTVTRVFEIERNGEKGDMQTTYEIYLSDEEPEKGLKVSDLGELPQIVGGIVLDKTVDDMEYYLEEGQFPPTDDDTNNDEEDERPVRRRDASNKSDRRTPRGRRGESF
mgnify:CR=1 FL=1